MTITAEDHPLDAGQVNPTMPESVEDSPDQLDALVDGLMAQGFAGGEEESGGKEPPVQPQPDEKQGKEKPAEKPEQPEPMKAPEHWAKEDKERFEKLPRDAQDFLLGRHKAMESDYTRKTQEIAEKQRILTPWEAHIRALQQDPRYFQHVFYGYGQQGQGQPAQAQEQPPDDPVEALKYEIRQDLMKDLGGHLEPLTRQQQMLAQQAAIQNTMAHVQRDPMFDAVQGKLKEFVESQPEGVKEYTFRQLDSNPQVYMQYYNHFRAQIDQAKAGQPEQPAQAKPSAEKPPVQPSRKERAPLLEDPGRTVPTAEEASENKRRIKSLRAKVAKGSASMEEVGEILEMDGSLDYLLQHMS